MSNRLDSKKLFDSGDAVEELSIVSARVAKDDGDIVSERSFGI